MNRSTPTTAIPGYSHPSPGSAQPLDETQELLRLLDEHRQAFDNLEVLCGIITTRLQPVLAPEKPSPQTTDMPTACESGFGGSYSSQIQRIRDLTETLDGLRARIRI